MKNALKITHYLNILALLTATVVIITNLQTGMILSFIGLGLLQPFLSLILLSSSHYVEKKTYSLVGIYWATIFTCLLTMFIGAYISVIGSILAFLPLIIALYFGFVTYKFQKNQNK